jgi:hypothetical protein
MRWSEQDDLAFGVAVDHIKIVRDVAAQHGNVTAGGSGPWPDGGTFP